MSFREWLFYELQDDGIIDDDTDIDIESYDCDDLVNSTEFEMMDMPDYVSLYRDDCAAKGVEPVFDLDVEET